MRRRTWPYLVAVAFAAALLLRGAPATPADVPETKAAAAPARHPGRCAPVRLRADRRDAACRPRIAPQRLAAEGGVLGVGTFWDVSAPQEGLPPATPCGGPYGHPRNAAFVRQVRGARGPDDPALRIVHMGRFELVPVSFAALPGFDADFLLRTRRPFSRVQRFFEADRSAPCRPDGCVWSDSFQADPARDPGRRLRDYIDRSGGPATHREVVYYLARATEGRRRFWPRAAIADLGNPAYRAWRVAEARRALVTGGYDAVLLNHKLPQVRDPAGFWIDAPGRRDVAAIDRGGDTLWSAPPVGYGFTEYVQGWAALGRDLRAAGVPYSVMLTAGAFAGRGYDDPATRDVDEGGLIQSTAAGASLVVILGRTGAEEARRVEAAVGPETDVVLARPGPDACPARAEDQPGPDATTPGSSP